MGEGEWRGREREREGKRRGNGGKRRGQAPQTFWHRTTPELSLSYCT